MFCPKCGAEYRKGFTECSDCKIPLVLNLPPQPKPKQEQKLTRKQEPKLKQIELVNVFKSRIFIFGDMSTVAIAKSILESAEIQYFVKNEVLSRFWPALGVISPTEIWVKKEDEKDARKLLEELEQNEKK